MSRPERKQRITRDHPTPVKRQCELLAISRSNAYYQPVEVSEEQRSVMRKLDELHLSHPYYGARRLSHALFDEHGLVVNRKQVQRLMKVMQVRTLPSIPGETERPVCPIKRTVFILICSLIYPLPGPIRCGVPI